MSDSSSEDENALPEILNFHRPTVELHPDYLKSPPYPSQSPITFYDKHLDEFRTLKHVRRLPSLGKALASGLDQALASFEESHGGQPLIMSELYVDPQPSTMISDAVSIAQVYEKGIAESASTIASVLAFHPDMCRDDRVLYWSCSGSPDVRNCFAADIYGLCVAQRKYHLIDKVTEANEETGAVLLKLIERLPILGIWDVYIPAGEELLKSMEELADLGSFPWQTCNATGPQNEFRLPPILDADPSATPWTLEDSDMHSPRVPPEDNFTANTPRRSTRLKDLHANTKIRTDNKAVRLPKLSRKGKGIYRIDPAHYLQHAWCRAVDADSTVIVFDCGDFQRIGIRVRGSQTLYLSDLIDVRVCEDPAYGKLQAGLYLAIIHDAMNRVQMPKSVDISLTTAQPRKRNREDDANVPDKGRKRRKVTAVDSDGAPPAQLDGSHPLTEESMRRFAIPTLLLVQFRYDSYNSPSPAPFIRSGPMLFPMEKHPIPFAKPRRKLTYAAHEYLTLTLGPQIGHGAVGNVHRGTLQLQRSDGTSWSCSAVAKFAFSPTQQEQLRHEYSIYSHLMSSEVELHGIVRIFGLFVNTDGGPVALLMGDGGSPLGYRHDADGQVKVPPDESILFLRALDSMHNAGVRHCDIRSWNLLVGNDGDVTIIDFDRAELNSSELKKRREREDLLRLLDGRYICDW